MIQSRPLGLGGYHAAEYHAKRPHRLEAQDGALSRPKLGFESPWGHQKKVAMKAAFCFQTGVPSGGMLFESPWGHQKKVAMKAAFCFPSALLQTFIIPSP